MIRIIGSRDTKEPEAINTTSHSNAEWSRGLSPFTATNTLGYAINVVNRKHFKGISEYIGRTMPGLPGSPLGNQYKIKPHGPYSREQSVLTLYRRWLWKQMQDANSAAYMELIRLTEISKTQELNLSCWCAPELCHGTIVSNAITFLMNTRP